MENLTGCEKHEAQEAHARELTHNDIQRTEEKYINTRKNTATFSVVGDNNTRADSTGRWAHTKTCPYNSQHASNCGCAHAKEEDDDAVDALEMLRQKRLDELREAARGEEKTDNDIDVPYNMLRNALFKPNRGVVLHLYIFIFVGVCLCFTCIMIKTETGLHSIQ
eukprot:m.192402 g.192402  ORF g.192402 m.192402 type:complete len:165 (-) comp15653_c0_seq3:472-966(-)